MSIKHFCDECGKEIKEESLETKFNATLINEKFTEDKSVGIYVKIELLGDMSLLFDICATCFMKLAIKYMGKELE